jgi:hypothetical protein
LSISKSSEIYCLTKSTTNPKSSLTNPKSTKKSTTKKNHIKATCNNNEIVMSKYSVYKKKILEKEEECMYDYSTIHETCKPKS